MSETCFYIECLKEELQKRKNADQKYSLRIYAKDLGLDPSTLSSIMRGLRPFPWRHAKAVAQKLDFDETTFKKFVQSVHQDISDIDIELGSAHSKVLDMKQYSKMIEEWEYYAILTYFETKNPSIDFQVIANEFRITKDRVQQVVGELIQYGFLSQDAQGIIRRATESVKTPEDISSESLRKAHLQEMEIVKERMHALEPLMRDISSITFAGDPERVKQAKRLIRSFRLKLNRLMETEKANDVFMLSIQLVPLTSANKRGV